MKELWVPGKKKEEDKDEVRFIALLTNGGIALWFSTKKMGVDVAEMASYGYGKKLTVRGQQALFLAKSDWRGDKRQKPTRSRPFDSDRNDWKRCFNGKKTNPHY